MCRRERARYVGGRAESNHALAAPIYPRSRPRDATHAATRTGVGVPSAAVVVLPEREDARERHLRENKSHNLPPPTYRAREEVRALGDGHIPAARNFCAPCGRCTRCRSFIGRGEERLGGKRGYPRQPLFRTLAKIQVATTLKLVIIINGITPIPSFRRQQKDPQTFIRKGSSGVSVCSHFDRTSIATKGE